MKTYRVAAVVVLLLTGLAAMASPYYEKDRGDAGRLLMGRVVDHGDNPLPSAVVYLSNPRNRAVKTYIVGADGVYRFPSLSPNIDYEVYAQYNGRSSGLQTVPKIRA